MAMQMLREAISPATADFCGAGIVMCFSWDAKSTHDVGCPKTSLLVLLSFPGTKGASSLLWCRGGKPGMTMLVLAFLSLSNNQYSSLSLLVPHQTDKKAMKENYLRSQRFKVCQNFLYSPASLISPAGCSPSPVLLQVPTEVSPFVDFRWMCCASCPWISSTSKWV